MTCQEIEQKIEALAREYYETHDPEIPKEILKWLGVGRWTIEGPGSRSVPPLTTLPSKCYRDEVSQQSVRTNLPGLQGLGARTKGVPSMSLRDHPLMRYRGVASWPPNWTWTGGLEDKSPKGEVGVFRRVSESNIQPANRCFLFIDFEESSYVGVFNSRLPRFLHQYSEIPASALQSSHR